MYLYEFILGNNELGKLLMKVRSECSKSVESKSSLQLSHTNTSCSNPSSTKLIPSNEDVIEFYYTDKPYFEFTPYSRHTVYLDNILWKTLNHYFQAQKFASNNDKRKIADAPTPVRATYLAKNELKQVWFTILFTCMVYLNYLNYILFSYLSFRLLMKKKLL